MSVQAYTYRDGRPVAKVPCGRCQGGELTDIDGKAVGCIACRKTGFYERTLVISDSHVVLEQLREIQACAARLEARIYLLREPYDPKHYFERFVAESHEAIVYAWDGLSKSNPAPIRFSRQSLEVRP